MMAMPMLLSWRLVRPVLRYDEDLHRTGSQDGRHQHQDAFLILITDIALEMESVELSLLSGMGVS